MDNKVLSRRVLPDQGRYPQPPSQNGITVTPTEFATGYAILKTVFIIMLHKMLRLLSILMKWIKDGVVGTAAGRQRGRSSSSGRVKNYNFSTSSRQALGCTQWVPGALSPGVNRQGREADFSLPTGAEVKKTWIYTSTPPYVFMA
jgi:hypothetical protein